MLIVAPNYLNLSIFRNFFFVTGSTTPLYTKSITFVLLALKPTLLEF